MKNKTHFFQTVLLACLAGALLGGCGKGSLQENGTKSAAETAAAEDTKEASGGAETDEEAGAAEESAEAADGTEADSDALFGTFTAYTQQGDAVTQEIFSQAQLTMVNIWATFCGPCISEMPELKALSEAYEEGTFQIVGIISDVTEPENEEAQAIIDATGADYTHIVLSEQLYRNFLRQVQAVPTTVFVDGQGRQVGDILVGARDKETWMEEVDKRLETVQDEAQDDVQDGPQDEVQDEAQ